MHPVAKQGLFAGRQKLGSLIRGQVELFGQTIDGITDAGLAGGGHHQHGKHEGLVVRDGPSADYNPDRQGNKESFRQRGNCRTIPPKPVRYLVRGTLRSLRLRAACNTRSRRWAKNRGGNMP